MHRNYWKEIFKRAFKKAFAAFGITDLPRGLVLAFLWVSGMVALWATDSHVKVGGSDIDAKLIAAGATLLPFAVFAVWGLIHEPALLDAERQVRLAEVEGEARRLITPKLAISFDSRTCLFSQRLRHQPAPGLMVGSYNRVVRLAVTSASGRAVEHCRAYLKSVTKKDSSGRFRGVAYRQQLPLHWHLEGVDGTTVPAGVVRHIELLSATAYDNMLQLVGDNTPHSAQEIFKKPGVYRLVVAVVGDGITQEFELEIDWQGEWSKLEASEIPVKT